MTQKRYNVIYLTGPPASGKSSLVSFLEQHFSPIKSFTYSKVLAEYVGRKNQSFYSQDQMREMSAKVISPQDVEDVDALLLDFVEENANDAHVVIDSHAVTKEDYGFRVTAFSPEKLKQLRPTQIFSLYTTPSVVVDRIKRDSQGRPSVSDFEAGFHCALQSTVALNYGLQLGIPVYFLDSANPTSELASEIAKRINAGRK